MSRAYFTDDMKLVKPATLPPLWGPETCFEMENRLRDKGYLVSVSGGIDHTGTFQNTWSVERSMVGFFVERLFQKRVILEIEAKQHYMVDLYFVCRNPASTIFQVINHMPKNKGVDFS